MGNEAGTGKDGAHHVQPLIQNGYAPEQRSGWVERGRGLLGCEGDFFVTEAMRITAPRFSLTGTFGFGRQTVFAHFFSAQDRPLPLLYITMCGRACASLRVPAQPCVRARLCEGGE